MISQIQIAKSSLQQIIFAERRHITNWFSRAINESQRRIKGERGDTYAIRQTKRHIKKLNKAIQSLNILEN